MTPQRQSTPRSSICIVQMTRAGDIIQTITAAKELKRQHSDIDLYFVGRGSFTRPLNFLLEEIFEEIYTIDLSNSLSQDACLDEVIDDLGEQIAHINKREYDVVANLSYSNSSGYLASLIKSRFKLGIYRNKQGYLEINDHWSQYVYATVLNGANNPFNLVDVFKWILGAKSQKYFRVVNQNQNQKDTIIVHPFSSHEKKQWEPYKWSEVIYTLAKEFPDLSVKIIGGPGEKERASRILKAPQLTKYQDRVSSIVGETSLRSLHDLMKNASLFVGHDSLGLHMAALQKVPCVIVSLGTVRPFETSPYDVDSINLAPKVNCFPCFPDTKCDYFICHNDIPVGAITASAKILLEEKEFSFDFYQEHANSILLDKVRIYRSRQVRNLGAYLQTLPGIECEIDDLFKSFYSLLWNLALNDADHKLELPHISEAVRQRCQEYLHGLEQLFELADFGKKYSQYISEESQSATPNLKKIRQYSDRLLEIDELYALITRNHPLLAPLTHFFRVKKGAIKSSSLNEMAVMNFRVFEDLKNYAQVLYELIGSCLGQNLTEEETDAGQP